MSANEQKYQLYSLFCALRSWYMCEWKKGDNIIIISNKFDRITYVVMEIIPRIDLIINQKNTIKKDALSWLFYNG